jgi:hypothetical protein
MPPLTPAPYLKSRSHTPLIVARFRDWTPKIVDRRFLDGRPTKHSPVHLLPPQRNAMSAHNSQIASLDIQPICAARREACTAVPGPENPIQALARGVI